MPKIVRLTRDMRPWRKGDDAVVPDELAAKLIEHGDAEDPRPYPPPDVAPRVPVRVAPKPRRHVARERGEA